VARPFWRGLGKAAVGIVCFADCHCCPKSLNDPLGRAWPLGLGVLRGAGPLAFMVRRFSGFPPVESRLNGSQKINWKHIGSSLSRPGPAWPLRLETLHIVYDSLCFQRWA
jgi:hypothetical protein